MQSTGLGRDSLATGFGLIRSSDYREQLFPLLPPRPGSSHFRGGGDPIWNIRRIYPVFKKSFLPLLFIEVLCSWVSYALFKSTAFLTTCRKSAITFRSFGSFRLLSMRRNFSPVILPIKYLFVFRLYLMIWMLSF